MDKTKTSFVDYYKSRQISPVDQDISDLALHFSRRESLYLQLGITKCNISERDIIEFGPGSGHNALYTAYFKPNKYVLVDGNEFGLEKTKSLLSHYYPGDNFKYVESLIENFQNINSDKYALVLCEGLLPFQVEPKTILKSCSNYVENGGLFVITTACCASFFSEYLRRVYFHVSTKEILNLNEKENFVHDEIESHLNTLLGRSRSTKNWIQDSFQPLNQRPSFSIVDAIDVLKDDFSFLGSSPSVLLDYRWYKSAPFGPSRNEMMKETYFKNIHNFIDMRHPTFEIDPNMGKKIYDITHDIEILSWNYELSCHSIKELNELLVEKLQELNQTLTSLNLLKTVSSINEFIHFLKTDFANFNEFKSFWGRGQQYLSFVKNNNYVFNNKYM